MNVFVAHSPTDWRTANKLALDLMKRGFDVFIDQPPPDDKPLDEDKHRAAILEGIEGADLFVVLISPTALTNPDLHEQVEIAREKQRSTIAMIRQECELTKRMDAALVDVDQVRFDRANYDAGVRLLLERLGVDPDLIVNDIVSSLEADKWMPGLWDVSFTNDLSKLKGGGQFEFLHKGEMAGKLVVLRGKVEFTMRIQGRWQFSGDRFSVQGELNIQVNIEHSDLPRRLPYTLSLRITELTHGLFTGVSTIGDTAVFQKVADAPPLA